MYMYFWHAIYSGSSVSVISYPHAGLSAMVRGAANSRNFTVIDYNETEVEKILHDYFAQLKS